MTTLLRVVWSWNLAGMARGASAGLHMGGGCVYLRKHLRSLRLAIRE